MRVGECALRGDRQRALREYAGKVTAVARVSVNVARWVDFLSNCICSGRECLGGRLASDERRGARGKHRAIPDAEQSDARACDPTGRIERKFRGHTGQREVAVPTRHLEKRVP
jgi:hypothetical protein